MSDIFGRCYCVRRTVFSRIREANLKLKPSKCHLARPSLRYLGHIVSATGDATDPEKMWCVKEWPTTVSVPDVRRCIGFVSYYCRFVQDFAPIAKPLHALTVKGQKFQWGTEEDRAFKKLWTLLTEVPPLAYPDFSLTFTLDTDARVVGIGAYPRCSRAGRW